MNTIFISHQDILDISKHKDENGVISLYLYSDPTETTRDFSAHFESLADQLNREAEKHGAKSKHMKMLIQQAHDKRNTLLDQFIENKSQTFCLFLSKEFNKQAELPIRLNERAIIDNEFYLLPLLAILEQFERFAILVFGREKARLYGYYLGKILERETVFHDYTIPRFNASTSSWRCLREKTVNHKIDNTYHRHLKEVSQILFDNFKTFGFDKLILASHQSEINSIKRHLHSYLIPKVIGEFIADADDPVSTIHEKADVVIAGYRENKEKAKITELLDNFAHKKAVLGIDPVINSLMIGNARQIVVSDDFHIEGYVCPSDHFMTISSARDKICPICRNQLVRYQFLEDHIIESAFSQKIEVFHILHQKEMLSDHNIGAILRF